MRPVCHPRHPRRASALALACLLLALAAPGCTYFKADRARINGWDALEAGDYETARADFQTCVDLDSTDWVSHYYLGQIALNHLNDASLARKHFELAQTIWETKGTSRYGEEVSQGKRVVPRPTRAQLTDGVAEAIFRERQTRQLFAYLRNNVDEHGETSDYLRLAHYLHATGDNDAAKTTYEKTISLAAPDDTEPFIQFAAFYDDIGDRDAALTQLRHVYFLNPKLKGIDDKLRAHGTVPGPTIGLPPVRN